MFDGFFGWIFTIRGEEVNETFYLKTKKLIKYMNEVNRT